MKVVIDTNVLLVSAAPQSKTYELLEALVDGKIELCMTDQIFLEYEEIFYRLGGFMAKTFMSEVLLDLPKLSYFTVYYKWNLIEVDSDDNKFVDCAIAANADYIITEDKHFNILKTIKFPKIEIINSANFIQQYLKK